jgi:hypothetical protein
MRLLFLGSLVVAGFIAVASSASAQQTNALGCTTTRHLFRDVYHDPWSGETIDNREGALPSWPLVFGAWHFGVTNGFGWPQDAVKALQNDLSHGFTAKLCPRPTEISIKVAAIRSAHTGPGGIWQYTFPIRVDRRAVYRVIDTQYRLYDVQVDVRNSAGHLVYRSPIFRSSG